MESESDNESIEGIVDNVPPATSSKDRGAWGKSKKDYYYTDYVDKDYPNKLSSKEERSAAIEQEEALRIQKKLLSTLDNVVDLQEVFDEEVSENQEEGLENLLDLIEKQNNSIGTANENVKKRKRVNFADQADEEEDDYDDEDDEDDDDDSADDEEEEEKVEEGRKRRPINMAIKKNRGLTPYKKKEYRNPRVKHKLKYKKAMTKRRRLVKEAKTEYHRYSGEATGIKTSTIKSIKLC